MPAPKMNLKFRKIDDLVRDPGNARTHSDEQIAQLVGLIMRFGWTNPILDDGRIIAGHGRLRAAERIYEMGELIYAVPGKANGGAALPTGTVPVIDCAGLTDDEKRALSLADNQSALNAGWDERQLAAEMAMLAAAEFEIELIGFDQERIDEMMKSLGEQSQNPALPPNEFPEYGDDIQTEHKCPKCGYEWSGKAS